MKKFLGLVLTLVILVLLLDWCSSSANEYTSEGVVYKVYEDEGYVEVVDSAGDMQEIKIASEYDGLPVTKIADEAFSDCDSLTSVVIPDSVTSIGESAFYKCSSLTSVAIPNGVTSIGESAFHGCSSLTSIVIPDSVTSIGKHAFLSCNSLNFNTYGDCKYLGNEGNPYLALFDTKNRNYDSKYKIHPDTKVIADAVFNGCYSIYSIVIPDSVTSISSMAFSGCGYLTSVVISDSVTSIGDYAFSSCSSLTDVYYTGTEEEWAKINIGSGNAYLTSATIHYEYVPAE